MRTKLVVFVIAVASLIFGLLFARQLINSRNLPREEFTIKKMRILTYGSFLSATGPGREILARFEQETGVKVEAIVSTDAGMLLERLKLAQASVPIDVVLGIDQLLLEDAQKNFEWRPVVADKSKWFEPASAASTAEFVAFDWSPLTFVYREDNQPRPKDFEDLLNPQFQKQFALQDPHASTPGLQFFHWIKALKGAETESWLAKFKPNVNSVSPSWGFSYGLFKKKQTRFVFSYLTSLAYHWGEDKDRSFRVLEFKEGHPVQVELAAIPKSCKECELAQSFVTLLHSEWAQKLIMTKNYMFPVLQNLEQGTVFAELPKLKTISTETGKTLSEWDKVFPR